MEKEVKDIKDVKSVDSDSRAALKRNIVRDVNYLLSKSWITEFELYNLVKKFLKSYAKLDYEFTKEELFKELENVYLPYSIRGDFFKFIEQVFLFEYSDVKYTDDELKLLLREFKKYVEVLLAPSFAQHPVTRALLLKRFRNTSTRSLLALTL